MKLAIQIKSQGYKRVLITYRLGFSSSLGDFFAWVNGILEEEQDCEAEGLTSLPEKENRKKN